MNFGVSGEMIFLFLLVLILFGPKKMPEIGRQVARILGEFRRASNEFRSQIESEVNSLDMGGKGTSNPRQQILPSLQAPLGSLASRIFNPPSPEKLEAVQEANAEAAAVKAAAAESVAVRAAAEDAAVETRLAPPSASKVAPDA
ncbi:MAG: twin-arginine translocase TatA/TatE family subunit [Terriglobales bacterium]|jgi:TatA/E family protein of Tat protein translocase